MSRDDNLAHAASAAAMELGQLWAAGTPPELEEYLAGQPRFAPGQLVQLIAIDQAERWRRGRRVLAEEYFRRYPAVAGDVEACLDLIYSEYVLRQEQGEASAGEELARRFPHLADRLHRLLQLEEFFADEPLDPKDLPVEPPLPKAPERRPRGWLAGVGAWLRRLIA